MKYIVFENGDETDFYSRGFNKKDLIILQSISEGYKELILISFVEDDYTEITFKTVWELVEPILKIFGPAFVIPKYPYVSMTFKLKQK